jgi:transposase
MRKSRLSWSIQRRLIEHFVSGSTARTAASLVGVNKSTAAFYFHRLREIIALESEDASPLFGEIEVDESYFGGHRKGKRDRGVGLAMHGVDNDTLRPIDGFTSAPRFILAEPTARSYDSSTEGQLYAHFHYASPVGLFMELPTQVF